MSVFKDTKLAKIIHVLIGGLVPFLLIYSRDFYMSAFLALMFGCSQSAFWCLTSPIVVDMMGLDQLATAFGVLTFTRGVACLLGPPLGGFIIDITGMAGIAL